MMELRTIVAGALVGANLLGVAATATTDAHSPAPYSVAASSDYRSNSSRKAEQLALSFYTVFDDGKVERLSNIVSKDWMDIPLAEGQGPGRAGLAPVVQYFRTVFPDLKVTPQAVHVVDDGTIVTIRTVFSGTQRAPFLGLPATGARITFRTTDVHRISRGRIVETWHLEDTFGAYQQMQAAAAGETS